MTSTIKVNNIQNQCGANIINESSNTITLGASGDTVTLASGASQTGFGRTGTVDWQTTKKTATFTAANGEGYFVDTSGGAVTMNLPSSPSAGNIVAVKDYSGDFATNNLTIGRGGSPINGGNFGDVVISTDGASIVLVYVDGTQGWVATQDDSSTFRGEDFITATGGTITTCGDYKIHTFTGPGTFCVSQIASNTPDNTISYVVVAGGGSGGNDNSGGGGAGGFREYKNSCDPYTASPLNGNPGGTAITITATGYPITVGGGGASVTACSTIGNNGSNSVFSTITSTAGGGGGAYPGGTPSSGPGNAGGSGGGGYIGPNAGPPTSNAGAAGNTPPVTPSQGNPGGTGKYEPAGNSGGGGGGATSAGGNSTASSSPGGQAGGGGTGATTSISGSPTGYAGGGGGGAGGSDYGGNASTCLTGGFGGANSGTPDGNRTGAPPTQPSCTAGNGTDNRGGGGGGNNNNPSGTGSGGSGIVIIRYKYK